MTHGYDTELAEMTDAEVAALQDALMVQVEAARTMVLRQAFLDVAAKRHGIALKRNGSGGDVAASDWGKE